MESTENSLNGQLTRKMFDVEDQIIELDMAFAENRKEYKETRKLLEKRLANVKQGLRNGAIQPDMFSNDQ